MSHSALFDSAGGCRTQVGQRQEASPFRAIPKKHENFFGVDSAPAGLI